MQPVLRRERMQVARDVQPECEAEDLALVEPVAHHVGRVALEDAEVLFQNFAERPVGDALAVGETSPRSAQRLRLRLRKLLPQLADQTCLADAGVAENRDEDRMRSLDRAAVGGLE